MASVIRAPTSSVTNRTVLRTAPYPWLSTSTSSPAANRNDRSTALQPEVALSTNPISLPSAPRNAPSRAAATANPAGSVSCMNRVGCASSCARQSCCAASTMRGVAPNEP